MTMSHLHYFTSVVLAIAAPPLVIRAAEAQGGRGGAPSGPAQQAQQLDRQGAHTEARAIFERLIDEAPDPATQAAARRRMAMSYGFEGDCANAVKYEEMVIAYWVTREPAEPQNAFYQQGEMANEAARVCLDAGDLDTAERMYQRDPFMHCLLAMTYERMGRQEEAKAMYQQAYDLATAHNPPAAFARRFVRQKLGLP